MAPRKKGKRRDDDDDWENEALGDADQAKNAEAVPETSEETKPKKGKSKGKKGKHVDSEDESESKDIVKEEDIKPVKKGKNKKSAKKDDNWEEEEDVKEKVEEQEEEVVKPSKKGKKGKKVVDWEEEEEDMKEKVEEEEEEVVKPAKKGKKAKKAVDWELLEVEQAEKEEEVEVEEKPVKKEKGKKQKKVDDWEEEEEREKEEKEREVVEEKDEEVVTGGIKTAAQKKAEKKQKEKEKKKAQAANKKKDKKEEDLDSLLAELAPAPAVPEVPVAEPVAAEIEEDEGEGEEKGEGAKKNKKKKKKTAAKEKEEPEAAKPAKVNARVKAMQEALQLKLELEEAMRKEEEAARLAEDERIRKIEEEARLEKERKEQKKIREAEKKARLKAEGKLLTKAQREAQAKREAYLASLKAQGLELPKADEGEKKKKVVYSKKKKATKTTEEAKPEVEIEEQIETETSKESGDKPTTDKPVEEDAPASWEDEGVVESWEEAETEQIKEVEKVEEPPKVGASTTTPVKKPTKKPTQSESESSDSDSDSDSDSESESETDNKKEKENNIAIAKKRIAERLREAEANKSKDNLRSPICCVLGHVDTGKTKILDHIRRSNVQNGEAGGITQQIGATYVPAEALTDRTKELNDKGKMQINVPGLLIIDTPGHESFSNLRSRGSSLCDISVLVIDVMHGLEPQTIESIQLLRKGKTPFVVALNKVDRFYGWQANPNSPIRATLKKQKEHVLQEFKERSQLVITQLAEQGLNAALYYENSDVRKYVSLVPCSAVTGEGLPDLLMLLVQLTQKLMSDRIAFINKVECSVLEVKMIQGLGTTVDVILSQGVLRTGDTIVVSGLDGPIVTSIRALLMPQPMKELRVKSAYQNYEEIYAAQGVKISAKGLEEAVAGTQLYVAHGPEEVEYYKTLVRKDLENALQSLKTDERGVTAQASTLGALEALLVFLRDSKIPVGNVNIGPVNRRDVVKCSTQMNHNEEYGVILAFDVKVSKDAADMAKDMGVIIFTADIIYHLFDRFTEHMAQLHEKKKEEHRHKAWFPCYMTVKPEFVFNTRDPIIMGVDIVEGRLTCGVPIVVPSKEFLEIGIIESIEINNKQMTEAKVGQSVCVKIRNTHDAPRMFGRHFDETDMLCTNLKRETIDILKEYFRDDMTKEDWRLILKMKKQFGII